MKYLLSPCALLFQPKINEIVPSRNAVHFEPQKIVLQVRNAKSCQSSKGNSLKNFTVYNTAFSIASLTFGLKVASCVRFSSMKQLTSFASRRMKHSNYAVRPKRSHGEFLTINVSPFLSSLRHNMGGLLVYPMPLSFVLFLMEAKPSFFATFRNGFQ